eukprot:CAMPEP_0118722814 /NCGR_PEP_ID=MMETSP0800-20121206/31639_1 /TAXON_ID=210618 ORGANISM="Striatella unipunctata, Strain CCMP2910" /NCGR_SAMPLE_ID=MMETSP0800 /ASSEMBLY_ACC=CAM_ASM_000638 /LENGTH=353 /DNA_ID=CAMNT_0006631135 /DNA_START=377 /DNA_END=1438 /DNA_ORIENTATION=+
MIANFGSTATSVENAEYAALQYYWWFMVVTAFSGTTFATMALDAIDRAELEDDAQGLLEKIAETIPSQTSAAWINWIIVRTLITLPLQYLLQVNTFIFAALGWKCCARASMGGGSGGQAPYRIYIDSGVVFLCTVALGPASPIVAPCALCYFLFMLPILRRNMIFVYRPRFDSGGSRWPFLFDVCISSLLVGQLLLATMMGLKEAMGPSLFALLSMIPTISFRFRAVDKYLSNFQDAGLLQTSLLDEWDPSTPGDPSRREAFRRFLVDAHKAAYIPVCIAGGATRMLTAEPAVVVPNDYDLTQSNVGMPSTMSLEDAKCGDSYVYDESSDSIRDVGQSGASMRRLRYRHMRNM